MILPKLAFRNLLGGGLRTVLNVVVLSFAFVALVASHGFIRGMDEQISRAMIDTEFLAGARARGFRIVEVPVTHLPRVAGEATGANIKVVIKAFHDLVQFRRRLSLELREERRQKQGADESV